MLQGLLCEKIWQLIHHIQSKNIFKELKVTFKLEERILITHKTADDLCAEKYKFFHRKKRWFLYNINLLICMWFSFTALWKINGKQKWTAMKKYKHETVYHAQNRKTAVKTKSFMVWAASHENLPNDLKQRWFRLTYIYKESVQITLRSTKDICGYKGKWKQREDKPIKKRTGLPCLLGCSLKEKNYCLCATFQKLHFSLILCNNRTCRIKTYLTLSMPLVTSVHVDKT